MLFVEFDFIRCIMHFAVWRFCIHLALWTLWSSFLIIPFFLNPTCDDITVISLLAAGNNCSVICFFSEITCMCCERSGDKATTPERNHETNNKQCTGVSSDTGSRLEHDQRRGETEMSGPSVWQQIERWEIGVSVPLLEDLCSSACGLCVCVLSHTRSCFIQYQGINIHSVEHDWQSVYFREEKWQTLSLSLFGFILLSLLLYLT